MATVQRAAEIIWHIEPRWRDRLLADGRVPLDDWLHSDGAEKIKDGRFRTVYRVRVGELDLHVKQCRPVGPRAWLREWLRPAKALLEFRRIREVARRHVPTLQALACGVARCVGPADSYLITESLGDTMSLASFLKTPPAPGSRQTLCRELGRFLALLHRAGVCHTDLHPGNILLKWNQDKPAFVLIDLHDVAVGKPLSFAASIDNLIVFNRWFVLRASRTDRLRCWHAYCAARAENEPSWQTAMSWHARVLEDRTWRSNRCFWRGRMSRCLHSNRHFRRLREAGIDGYAVRDLDAAAITPYLRDPEAMFRDAIGPLLKDSRSSTVAELELVVGGERQRVICKRFRVTSAWDPITALFRPAACLRSWVNGHSFVDSLLPTPRPLAFWHRRQRGLCQEGYLLVEKVENAFDLHTFLHELKSRPPGERTRALRRWIEQIAYWVREMHRRGWSHRDLKATNILLSREGEERVSFIDLVGARRRHASVERRCRDLARLNASFINQPILSRTDRLRFLRIYLCWNFHGPGDWKSWWRHIDELTKQKQQQNARRGRPLT